MSDFTDRLRATGGKGQGGPVKQQAADLIDEMEKALTDAKHALEAELENRGDEDANYDFPVTPRVASIIATLSKLEAMK